MTKSYGKCAKCKTPFTAKDDPIVIAGFGRKRKVCQKCFESKDFNTWRDETNLKALHRALQKNIKLFLDKEKDATENS